MGLKFCPTWWDVLHLEVDAEFCLPAGANQEGKAELPSGPKLLCDGGFFCFCGLLLKIRPVRSH